MAYDIDYGKLHTSVACVFYIEKYKKNLYNIEV